jgi:hypothetical protein
MEVGINLMELRDIIEKVSEMYRDEHGKINDLYQELRDIGKILDDDDQLENLLYSEYRRLINKKCDLQDEISKRKAYAEGISDVRELLMDIGFDVEIENNHSKEDLEKDSYDLKYRMIKDEIFAEVMRKEKKG